MLARRGSPLALNLPELNNYSKLEPSTNHSEVKPAVHTELFSFTEDYKFRILPPIRDFILGNVSYHPLRAFQEASASLYFTLMADHWTFTQELDRAIITPEILNVWAFVSK